MSQQRCLICASDEGIFLDIFSNNNVRDNIETCLSLKTKKSNLLSTKICHKCAYELDQCSKFVKKYTKTQIENGMLYKKHGYCSLCMEPGKKGLIFDLINENPLNNPQEKIYRLFNIDFTQGNFSNLSICLDCRYNLDVLFDLKCILNDHSDYLKKVFSGEIRSPNMEKIKTNVVRRTTTSAKPSPTKHTKDTLSDMDSDTSSVSENRSTRLRSNGSRSVPYKRQCEECRAKIPVGDDMFRYHTTGLTVCKQCWLKMDPSDSNDGKKRKISTETKLCCVFLKDIRTSSDNKPSTIEKDDSSDSIYTISDDSTVEENKPEPKKILQSKRKKNQRNKPLKKPKNDPSLRKSSRTRASSVQIEQVERKSLRSSRARSVELVQVMGSRSLPEKKTLVELNSSTNKSKLGKKTNEKSKLNSSSEKTNKKNVSNVTNRSQKRTRDKSNSSISSIEESISSKTNKKKNKLSCHKVESDSENSRPYTCNVCHYDFDNRVEGLTHELTHSKSLEVILKKVLITDNTDKVKKNDAKQTDELLNVTNDVSNEDQIDILTTDLSKKPTNKSCNKDDEKETDNPIKTIDNNFKEYENDKNGSNSEMIKINDKKNDDDNGHDDNDENRNDNKQNDNSDSVESNSENERRAADNNDDKRDSEKDGNKQDDSVIIIDTSSDNGNVSRVDHEKDDTDNHNSVTRTDNHVSGKCEVEEKTVEANEDADEKSSEKNTEATSNIICDDENVVDLEKSEDDGEKKEANKKIEPTTNNISENNHEEVNDNDDTNEEKEEENREKKEKAENEKEKSDEENEKCEKEEEKGADETEINQENKENKEEKKNNKHENAEELSQCLHDKTTNDSTAENGDDASLNNENVDEENKQQLADKTMENDQKSICNDKNETENISDGEDEGALIEQEMEKIKTHINKSKQVDGANVDLESIENSEELEKTSNDNKSLSELNNKNSENGEEP